MTISGDRHNPPDDLGAGQVVGWVASIEEAMAWVARWSFSGTGEASDPLALALGPAPVPGAELFQARGAILYSLRVRGRAPEGGPRTIRWPDAGAELIPADHPWVAAVLVAERAPLYAAPAAVLPASGERFTQVRRSGNLWLLGHVDRCEQRDGQRVCLRWARVIARNGDTFHAGYLPALQVATVDGWQRGSGAAPRAQLIASGVRGDQAQFVLLARTRDGGLHRRTLVSPLIDGHYPAAKLRVEGEVATIEFTGAKPQRVALDASMDARHR